MLRLRNPSPEDLDPPPAYTDSDPAFSPDPMDNPHLYSYAMDASNVDAKSSHLPRALIDDEKSRLKRAHQNTASISASAAAAATMGEEKTKRPPAAVHTNHQHHHLSSPPPRITVAPSSSATSTSTMATSFRSSFVSSSFSSSSSSFSRLSPPSLYTGSPNSQTSLATSTGGSSPSSSPEAPPVKMPPASSLLSSPPPNKAPTTTMTAESKPVRPSITPLAPRRSRSVPRGGHGGASYDLDRIDELDESDPLGMAFHHGGPYEAIRAQKLNSPSSRKEEKQLWPGQHEWQKLPSNQQFSLDVPLGLRPGQILPMEIKRMYDTSSPPPPSSSSLSLSLSSSTAAGGMHPHDRQYLRPPLPQDARHLYQSAQAPPPPPSSGAMVGTDTDDTAYMRSHIAPSASGERERHQQQQVQYGDYHRMGRSLHRHVIPEDSAHPKVVGVQPIPPPPPSHALALAPATGHVHRPPMEVNTNADPSVSFLPSSSAAAAAAQDRFDTVQERRKEGEEDVHVRALAHVKSSYSMKQQQQQQHPRAAEIADSVSIPQQVVTQPTRAATPMIMHVPEGEEEEGDQREVSELAYMRAGATPSPAPVQDTVHMSTLAAAGLLTSSRANRAHSRSPSSSGHQQSSSVPGATEHAVITVPVRSPSPHEYASLHPQPSFHSHQTLSSSTSSSSAAHSRQPSEPAHPSSAHHQYHHQQQQDAYRTVNDLSSSPAPPSVQPPTRAHTVSYQRTPAQQQPVQMRAAAVAVAQQSAIPPPEIRMPAPSIAPTASSTRSRQPAHVPKRLVMPTPLNPAAQGSIALANAAALHAQQQQHQPHAEAFLTQHHVHFNEQQQSRAKDSAAYVARARDIPMADGSRKVLRKRTVTGAEQDHHHHHQQQQQQLQQQQQQQQSRGRSLSLSFGRGKEKEKDDKRLGHAHSHGHGHSPSPLQQLPQQVQAQPLQPIVQRQQVQYQQQSQYPYQYQQQQQQQQRQAAPQIRTDIMTYAPSKEPWVFHHHHPQQAQQYTQAPVATTTTRTKTRAHASQAPPVQRNGSVAAKNMVPSQIDSSPWVHVSPVLHPVKGLPTTATVFAVADRREMAPSSKGRRLSKQRRGDV